MPRPLQVDLKLAGIPEAIGRLDELATRLEAFGKVTAGVASGVNGAANGVAAVAQAMNGAATATEKVATAARNAATETRDLGAAAEKVAKVVMGPHQRLLQYDTMRQTAREALSGEQLEAALKDIRRRELLDQRSAVLHGQRESDTASWLNGPGLLELFKKLNGLLGSMLGGRAGGAGSGVIDLMGYLGNEPAGGLNISQKLAGGLLGRFGGIGAATEGGAAGGGTAGLLGGPAGLALVAGAMAATKAIDLLRAMLETIVHVAVSAWQGLQNVARRLEEVGAAAARSGGSIGQLAGVAHLGFGAAQVAEMAAAFRSAIDVTGGNGLAFRAAGMLGINPQLPVGLGGPTNNAALFEQAVNRFEQLPYTLQRMVAANIPSLEAMLGRFNVTPAVRAAQRRDAALEAQINSPTAITGANSFNQALARIGANLSLLGTAFGKGALEPITGALVRMGDAIGRFAAFVDAHPAVPRLLGQMTAFFVDVATIGIRAGTGLALIAESLRKMGALELIVPSWIGKLFLGLATGFMKVGEIIYKMFQALGNVFGLKVPDLNAALDANTNATVAQTLAAQQLAAAWRQGFSGGGERARGAIPSALRGQMLQEALRSQRLVFGAFRL